MSIAHANFWYSERLKIRSNGTSFRLHLHLGWERVEG